MGEQRLTDQLIKLIAHRDYKWHCIDHLQYEGYLEDLLPNVPLEKEIEKKYVNEPMTDETVQQRSAIKSTATAKKSMKG